MILGIDVGGTRTDSVLINAKGVLAWSKTPTGQDLLHTIDMALEEVLKGFDPKKIQRAVFSTTLATNAIVQERIEPAAMMVMGGPGIDPEAFKIGPSYHVLEGVLDHQGFEVRPVSKEEVFYRASMIRKQGIHLLGVVGKFSPRNPEQEQFVYNLLKEQFLHISLGHRVSGVLNFPRRINTSYLNAALYPIQRRFVASLTEILKRKGLDCNRFLLKPDGGTFVLEKCLEYAASGAQSGPAASVMGAICLDGCKGVSLVLDIGGTTTDMSVVVDGTPLLAPWGVQLGRYKTLIRSILTRSVGIGGDSEVGLDPNGSIKIGPKRLGDPLAFGGPALTPTDAMVVLGLMDQGDTRKALEGIRDLDERTGTGDIRETAIRVLKAMAAQIQLAAKEFIAEINSRPVYTIHEVLYEKKVEPESMVLIGGPSRELAVFLSDAFELPYRVPRFSEVANAIGAAVSRVTAEVTVYADTQKGDLVIPEVEYQERIPYTFNEKEALLKGMESITSLGKALGADMDSLDIQVTERQVFNMVKGFYRTGQNMRFRLCLRPGIISFGEALR